MSPATIERIPVPSVEEFRERYLLPERPVIFSGAVDPSSGPWTPERLCDMVGDTQVSAASLISADSRWLFDTRHDRYLEIPFRAAIRTLQDADPSKRLYIPYFPAFAACPALERARPSLERFHGLSPAYPERIKRSLVVDPGMWIGPAGQVTPLHFDTPHNFLVQMYGRKRVILYAPSDSKNVYYPWPEFRRPPPYWTPVDPDQPDYEAFPRFRNAQPMIATLEPGESLFIPKLYFHHVRTLDVSISLNFWWYDGIFSAHVRTRYLPLMNRLLNALGPKPRPRSGGALA
jgi:[protein]-arginine 3-hydroxylase / protease